MSKCLRIGCLKRPTYNISEQKPAYCKEHKSEAMINVKRIRCTQTGCKTEGKYVLEGDSRFHCEKHKTENMALPHKKCCQIVNCATKPYYNVRGAEEPIYCKMHKTIDMVNFYRSVLQCHIKHCSREPIYKTVDNKPICAGHKDLTCVRVRGKFCAVDECSVTPSYKSLVDGKNYCSEHKAVDSTRIQGRRCNTTGCNIAASFCSPNSDQYYCGEHKSTEMINRYKKHCIEQGCEKEAAFGFDSVLCCSEHRTPTMMKLRQHRTCEKCEVTATYNFIEQKHGRFCTQHKLDGMISLVSRVCDHPNCFKGAPFGYKNNDSKRCGEHKDGDMIRIKKSYCTSKDCETTPIYGHVGKRATKCALHRSSGMIRHSRKRCIKKPCTNLALFGTLKPNHCEVHQEKHEINLQEQKCLKCGLENILSVDGFCDYCVPGTFKNQGIQQRLVQKHLEDSGIHFAQIDKVIHNGSCGRERPDFLIDCGTHYVIIECDEYAHNRSECARFCHCPIDDQGNKQYHCKCDVGRMHDISQSMGGQPGYFVRYNPDPKVRDCPPPESDRLKKLIEVVETLQTRPCDAFLSVIYLYYDSCTDPSLEILKAFNK